jgi:NAD(P)-dependent dehydrogenase (short-subunit alcohol dehydrogenase family)
VLVTGASTGIGREGARALMRKGFRVFAGARKQRDVDALRADHLTPVLIDVTDDESVARALAELTAHTGEDGLYALVNNAGIAVGGPLEAIPVDEVRAQFEVNVLGLLRVTQAFLPLLRRANAQRKSSRDPRARIVNIGSMSGRIATPFLGPYCMSKFAVEAMSDAMRMELLPFDIEVVVIEPGRVKTEIWAKGAESARTIANALSPAMTELYGPYLPGVEAAVVKTGETAISTTFTDRALIAALEDARPRTHVPVAKGGRAVLMLKALLPVPALDRMVKKMMGFS